jgi:tRNA(adenine34) deaminase
MSTSDLIWMQTAYALAKVAESQDEVPIGAVVVSRDNRLLGLGWNQVRQNNDPTSHAEIVAIRAAAKKLNNYRLNNTTIYVTLEPCCMCAAALVQARIARLVFATRNLAAGAAGSVYNLLTGYPLNHQVIIDEGLCQEESALILRDFFGCNATDQELQLSHLELI